MPVIEVRALEIIISNLPQIAKELKRIGDILEKNPNEGNKNEARFVVVFDNRQTEDDETTVESGILDNRTFTSKDEAFKAMMSDFECEREDWKGNVRDAENDIDSHIDSDSCYLTDSWNDIEKNWRIEKVVNGEC